MDTSLITRLADQMGSYMETCTDCLKARHKMSGENWYCIGLGEKTGNVSGSLVILLGPVKSSDEAGNLSLACP